MLRTTSLTTVGPRTQRGRDSRDVARWPAPLGAGTPHARSPTATTVLDSALFGDAFGTPRMRAIFSAITQDIMDTAVALQMRDRLALIGDDLSTSRRVLVVDRMLAQSARVPTS
jgi:hypothetical protein